MPLVPFESLGDDARVWVFSADPPLDEPLANELLVLVDEFLKDWAAHGKPLVAGREWRDDSFLVIAVDQTGSHASGCSIDGLFRTLADFEKHHGVSLLSRDNVYYRDGSGAVRGVSRDAFASLSATGGITADTTVFDTSITALGELRQRFELNAEGSWHRALLAR